MLGKIQSLHGTTPAEIFQTGLDNLGEIEAVALSVLWKNGTVKAGWSNVDISKLPFMILALDNRQRALFTRETEP